MKRDIHTTTACLLALGGSFAIACDNPVASDRLASRAAATVADRLPDLGMARLSDFSIGTANGRRVLRYSTTIVNVGSGPFELHGRRGSSSEG